MGICTSESNKTQPISDSKSSTPKLDYVERIGGACRRLLNIDLVNIPDRAVMSGRFIARIVSVYDGDTLTGVIYNESGKLELLKVRVYGSDTPELKGVTAQAGKAAKNAALTYMGADEAKDLKNGNEIQTYFKKNPTFVELECIPVREKFGRILARVRSLAGIATRDTTSAGGDDLSEHLIKLGLAYAYEGGTKDQSSYVE